MAGVPPAFRVNGEIILADEDALSEKERHAIAAGLLNEQQQKKFDEEWELCISLLHPAAGRVRATFYRRNGHPEMSFRFCGEHIPSREELGLPEKIDDLARKPNGLVLDHRPDRRGQDDHAQLHGGPDQQRTPLQDRHHRRPHRVRARRTSARSWCSRKCSATCARSTGR